MVNFQSLTSIESYIATHIRFEENDLNDNMIQYYVMGYLDLVNGYSDNRSYRRVTHITSIEEFLYMYGYNIGLCDINVEAPVVTNKVFDREYIDMIKCSLMLIDIPSTQHTLITWLELLKENT